MLYQPDGCARHGQLDDDRLTMNKEQQPITDDERLAAIKSERESAPPIHFPPFKRPGAGAGA